MSRPGTSVKCPNQTLSAVPCQRRAIVTVACAMDLHVSLVCSFMALFVRVPRRDTSLWLLLSLAGQGKAFAIVPLFLMSEGGDGWVSVSQMAECWPTRDQAVLPPTALAGEVPTCLSGGPAVHCAVVCCRLFVVSARSEANWQVANLLTGKVREDLNAILNSASLKKKKSKGKRKKTSNSL